MRRAYQIFNGLRLMQVQRFIYRIESREHSKVMVNVSISTRSKLSTHRLDRRRRHLFDACMRMDGSICIISIVANSDAEKYPINEFGSLLVWWRLKLTASYFRSIAGWALFVRRAAD